MLTAGSDRLDLEVMASLVGQVARLHSRGMECVLVSSGAVAAGRHRLGLADERREVPFKQVLAAVGQGRLMNAYDELFAWHDITIAQALLTRTDLGDRLGYLNARRTLASLLFLGVVPIVNENDVVAVEEMEDAIFGDNDTLSALVANLVDAEILILLSDTGGLHTSDPNVDSGARLVERVKKIDASVEALAGKTAGRRGTGGMLTKIQAAKIATASGVAVCMADGRERDVLIRIAEGQPVGTLFKPTASRLEGRKRRLLGRRSKGELVIDSGAAAALKEHNKSLLPAGVKEVRGDFGRGDIVSVLDCNGTARIACGITNYSAADICSIKGVRSDRIAERLGYEYGEEVVHRDNLVLL